MSDELKKDEQTPEVKTEPSGDSLPESELEKVAGAQTKLPLIRLASLGTLIRPVLYCFCS